jgi:hypothetical protein
MLFGVGRGKNERFVLRRSAKQWVNERCYSQSSKEKRRGHSKDRDPLSKVFRLVAPGGMALYVDADAVRNPFSGFRPEEVGGPCRFAVLFKVDL